VHLGVLLVEDVLRARDQLEALEPAEPVEDAVRPAGVHPRVAAVVDVAVAVELPAHDVDLGEEGKARDGLPGQPDAAGIARDARQEGAKRSRA